MLIIVTWTFDIKVRKDWQRWKSCNLYNLDARIIILVLSVYSFQHCLGLFLLTRKSHAHFTSMSFLIWMHFDIFVTSHSFLVFLFNSTTFLLMFSNVRKSDSYTSSMLHVIQHLITALTCIPFFEPYASFEVLHLFSSLGVCDLKNTVKAKYLAFCLNHHINVC